MTGSTLASADAPTAVRLARPSARVSTGALLLAVACVLGLVEAALPAFPVVPWLRLGLANIAVVVALALCGPRIAAAVSLGRVGIVALATGSVGTPAFAIALAGASASLLVMWAVRSRGAAFSLIGWSVAGSVAHVSAQFLAAAAIVGSWSLVMLAPPSILLALPLGALVGVLARITVSRLSER